MMDEARFARGPALLRFSAAHEARPPQRARPPGRTDTHGRAFAGTVVPVEGNGPVFAANTTDVG
jgi:hypothetical protein